MQNMADDDGIFTYIKEYVQAINSHNSQKLSDLLLISSNTRKQFESRSKYWQNPIANQYFDIYVNSFQDYTLAEKYKEVMIQYFFYLKAARENNFDDTLLSCMKLVIDFCKCAERETNWLLPTLKEVTSELKNAFHQKILYDKKLGKEISTELNEKIFDVLQKPFKICLQDKSDIHESKKKSVYYFANILFETYFKFEKYEAANNLAKVLKNSLNLPNLNNVIKSDSVTCYYYKGLIECMANNLTAGHDFLMESFNNCYYLNKRQQQLILVYLIPLKIILKNEFPNKQLWLKYPDIKTILYELVNSIQYGNIHKFKLNIKIIEKFLLKKHLYSIYLQLISNVQLNLIINIFKLLKSNPKISINDFLIGFKLSSQKENYTTNEVELIISNLIYKNLIKGYISHGHLMVVLSKKDPFPMSPSVTGVTI